MNLNRWTAYTILFVFLGCAVSVSVGFAITHRPVQPIWVMAIGGIVGAAAVQIVHRKRDPFTAG